VASIARPPVDERPGDDDNPPVFSRIAASAAGLAAIALVGLLAGTALSSTSARADDPLRTQTYTDPAGDNPSGAPDITGVVVSNLTDGTVSFEVKLPSNQALNFNTGIGVYIDTDANRATGQFGDDYFIAVLGGTALTYQLEKWSSTAWLAQPSATLKGQFRANDGLTVTIAKDELGIGSTFNFDVWSSVASGNVAAYSDEAPDQPNYFSYTLGTPTATTTTTTAPPTTTTSVAHLNGHVGPGATITLARSAKAGAAVFTIADKSTRDDFHLSGPGVDKRTGIPFKGTVTWRVTLRKGTYAFRSDAHAALHGTLSVS
jgi:hypothetical protein